MNVFWLEQTESDLPATDDWLSRTEAQLLSTMRFPKRRADWRLGRWTAKRALSICLGLPLDFPNAITVEVLAAPSGQPEAFVRGSPIPACISLSHRAGVALCTVAQAGTDMGCDLELIEPHSDAFASDYFTAEEQMLISGLASRERSLLLSVLWSAKESALKALHQGLRLDTRSLNVKLEHSREDCDLWLPLQVNYLADKRFYGCWSRSGEMIRTVVAAASSLQLIPLDPTPISASGTYTDVAFPREPLP